jgi:hypothetical protein
MPATAKTLRRDKDKNKDKDRNKDKGRDKAKPKDGQPLAMWIDPQRSPTYLAQKRLKGSGTASGIQLLDSSRSNEPGFERQFSKRRKTENASIRRWMDLGDLLLKTEEGSTTLEALTSPTPRKPSSARTSSARPRLLVSPRR